MKTKGKYSSYPKFLAAKLHREWRRRTVADMVKWEPLHANQLQPGCTAIVGMCHRLPDVLLGNLACLAANARDTLTEVIVTVDSVKGRLPPGLEDRAAEVVGDLPLRLLYYSEDQAGRADRIRLPYLYSWLSWSIAIAHCRTRTVLFHDYDALVLDDALTRRYRSFCESGARVQGIRWYNGSGILPEDRLATTFEAFVDLAWLRQFPPIRMFNRIGWYKGRTVDFDTLLDLQAYETTDAQRTIEPMTEDNLVHPSQMVHQFTMARRHPAAALPVFSLPMVPFFEWLSGRSDALDRTTARIDAASDRVVMFFDNVTVNFAQLRVEQVDWCLKQMLQTCVSLRLDPGRSLHAYGKALYRLAGSTAEEVWRGDFTPEQRAWIEATAPGSPV